MSFRTIAASAGMLAALTLAASSAASAETTGSSPAAASTHARAAKAQHRLVRPQREAKARRGKRARLALARHRHEPPAEPAADAVRRPTATAHADSTGDLREHSSAERRFREFLNPQSFAVVAAEELRSPRLAAAHFSSETAEPEIVVANSAAPVAVEEREGAPPIVARDQTAGDDSASKAPALAHSEPVPVERVAQSRKEPERMSYLRWFFVAWGGVLTLASAVRMAVG
jgi:hypothetical protein